MSNNQQYDADTRYVAEIQKLRFFPQTIIGGNGCFLVDDTDRMVLDLSASWGAASLGYSHPATISVFQDAITDQAGASILSSSTAPAVQLAERLVDLVPGGDNKKVWLGHSGSDANETVFRAVTEATGRHRILSFVGAYHGGSLGSIAISGHGIQSPSSRSSGLTLIPYPDPYRPFEGDPSGQSVLDLLEYYFCTICPPEEVAALFIECIQSDGGLIVPPQGFLAQLVNKCREHGILIVCDEVKIGLGRTGRLHSFEFEDFIPDIVTFGKGIGGGLPVSAVVAPEHILDFRTAFAMQTLHGNPICSAVANTVIDTIESEALVRNAKTQGQAFIDDLQRLATKHEIIGDIRGRGLVIGVEFVKNRTSKAPDSDFTAKFVYRCYQLGVIAYYVGRHSNVVELTPPLIITDHERQLAIDFFDQALTDVSMGKVSDKEIAEFSVW